MKRTSCTITRATVIRLVLLNVKVQGTEGAKCEPEVDGEEISGFPVLEPGFVPQLAKYDHNKRISMRMR